MEALNKFIWSFYYSKVIHDFTELKAVYPFSYLIIPPTMKPSIASIRALAVNRVIVDAVEGCLEDFTGEYSKEIYMDIPLNYWITGCGVYGCKWFDEKKFKPKDIHLFYSGNQLVENKYGYKMCVGVSDSFGHMNNVILEAIKTADNILVAYERVQSGLSDSVILNAYSHGLAGENEYLNDKTRYIPR